MSTIYEPQEDSLLLAAEVKKFSFGKVLDMGCGSGIQGVTALKSKKVNSVDFADINEEALNRVKKNNHDATIIHSDLFSRIKGRYDTIIFNPPYLPEDEFDNEKRITTGGKKGWEIIERFLIEAKDHLDINGIILIVFSSLTDKGKVDALIKKNNYEKNTLSRQKLFMEELFVYLLKQKHENVFKGHRGYVIVDKKKKIAIKSALKNYDAVGEAKFLKILNKNKIGPKYISNTENTLTMEYIDGIRIIEYIEKNDKKKILQVIKKILSQTYTMDSLGINKLEMTNPYKHIIVRKDNPIMIDFERCEYSKKVRNTTQFIQFICSTKMKYIFDEKKIKIDREALRKLSAEYKQNPDKNKISEILKAIE